MKKTITRPDGTTEVVEGTADEISEYERKLKGQPVLEAPKPGPGLLTDELKRLLGSNKNPYYVFPDLEHGPTCQLTVAQRGWWSVNFPMCTCGLIVCYTTDTIIDTFTFGLPPNTIGGGWIPPGKL